MAEFHYLFTPLRIGNVTVENRLNSRATIFQNSHDQDSRARPLARFFL